MGSQALNGSALPRDGFAHVTRPGIKNEDVIKGYNEWSKDSQYDKAFREEYGTAHSFLAAGVAKYQSDKQDSRILDIAAGTGLVAEKLRDLGFCNIDGLDAAQDMLEAARQKDLYKNYLCAFFTNDVDIVKTSTYDVLTCCGGFAEGHFKCDVLPEIIRCVKSGGLVAIVMRENFFQTVAEYKDRLEPYMKQLEEEGQWTPLERTIFPNYLPGYNGVRFVFKVSKKES